MQKIPLDIGNFKETGLFISAIPQHGKTNLAKIIMDNIMSNNFVTRVFDPSQKWLYSNIPYYIEIDSKILKKGFKYPFDGSLVFDISRLHIEKQKEFVKDVLACDFDILANSKPFPFFIAYGLEEAQLYLPQGSLQAKTSQETFRMVSVGHNFRQTNLLLTQRPADVDVRAISRCGQLYIGKHFEENDIRKISRFLHWNPKNTYEKLTKLEKGQFFYMILGSEPRLINTKLHKQTLKPIQLQPRR